mmetsp:Transcript_36117/g.81952  ORF Transcript_36117/g.81952 Transcript_36117/m.81952 type:complete len:393 (-) Transcript_36117:145-1323(-)
MVSGAHPRTCATPGGSTWPTVPTPLHRVPNLDMARVGIGTVLHLVNDTKAKSARSQAYSRARRSDTTLLCVMMTSLHSIKVAMPEAQQFVVTDSSIPPYWESKLVKELSVNVLRRPLKLKPSVTAVLTEFELAILLKLQLSGLHALYDLVVFVDVDALLVGSVDQSIAQFMAADERLLASEGTISPLHAGIYLLKPNADDHRRLQQTLLAFDFSVEMGWNQSGPLQRWSRSNPAHGLCLSWRFMGARADQGLLYYFFGLVSRSWAVVPPDTFGTVFPVLHFSGRQKPWMHTSHPYAAEEREAYAWKRRPEREVFWWLAHLDFLRSHPKMNGHCLQAGLGAPQFAKEVANAAWDLCLIASVITDIGSRELNPPVSVLSNWAGPMCDNLNLSHC